MLISPISNDLLLKYNQREFLAIVLRFMIDQRGPGQVLGAYHRRICRCEIQQF